MFDYELIDDYQETMNNVNSVVSKEIDEFYEDLGEINPKVLYKKYQFMLTNPLRVKEREAFSWQVSLMKKFDDKKSARQIYDFLNSWKEEDYHKALFNIVMTQSRPFNEFFDGKDEKPEIIIKRSMGELNKRCKEIYGVDFDRVNNSPVSQFERPPVELYENRDREEQDDYAFLSDYRELYTKYKEPVGKLLYKLSFKPEEVVIKTINKLFSKIHKDIQIFEKEAIYLYISNIIEYADIELSDVEYKFSNGMSLAAYDEMFGSEIWDIYLDLSPTLGTDDIDTYSIEKYVQSTINDYMDTYEDDYSDIKHNKHFFKGVMDAVYADTSSLYDNGWQLALSQNEENYKIYQKVLQKTGNKKAALAAYFNYGKVIGVTNRSVRIQKTLVDETYKITHSLFALKVENNELDTSNFSKILKIFQSKNWGTRVTRALEAVC